MSSYPVNPDISMLMHNCKVRDLASSYGLAINAVSWEDTARSKGSCWGPNICDMTLTVEGTRMPMIRKPNFSDVTADIPLDTFSVTIGNEKENPSVLERVPFREYVKHTLGLENMILPRDDVILTSAQACVLPLGSKGTVDFCPELYSYQASEDNPAVLTIVACHQGTSAQTITGRTQKLMFNQGGKSALYQAKRLSQDRKERNVEIVGEMTDDEMDRNILIVFQIPLKVKTSTRPNLIVQGQEFTNNSLTVTGSSSWYPFSLDVTGSVQGSSNTFLGYGSVQGSSNTFTGYATAQGNSNTFVGYGSDSTDPPAIRQCSGMEDAMLCVSDIDQGTFPTIQSQKLVRDERFPIRATFQMYKVTDDSNITEVDIKYIADKIADVYKSGNAIGSLVHETTSRMTEPTFKPLNFSKPLFASWTNTV